VGWSTDVDTDASCDGGVRFIGRGQDVVVD